MVGHAVLGLLLEPGGQASSNKSLVVMPDGPPRARAAAGIGVERRPHQARGLDAAATSPSPAGSPASPRPPAVAGRGSDGGRSRLASPGPAGGSRVRAGRDRRSSTRGRRPRGRSVGVSSTSTRWRRSRRASSMQARTSSRWSHASKRSGSRSVGRSRQARTSVFCTASLACSGIPEDEPGGGIQAGDRGACQLGEGVMIALPRSLHEVSLHPPLGVRRGRRDRAQRVWRGDVWPIRSESSSGAGRTRYHRLPSHRPLRRSAARP